MKGMKMEQTYTKKVTLVQKGLDYHFKSGNKVLEKVVKCGANFHAICRLHDTAEAAIGEVLKLWVRTAEDFGNDVTILLANKCGADLKLKYVQNVIVY